MTGLAVEILCKSFLLTLVFELLGAYLYGIRRRKDYGLIFFVNMLTNPAVVSIYYLTVKFVPGWLAAAVLEVSAIAAEGVIFKRCGEEIRRPMCFSALLNLFSYFAGSFINMLF